MSTSFTYDWFASVGCPGNWPKWLAPHVGVPTAALEIGCYEGRATCWLLEHVLTHPASSIACIDTFAGGHDHKHFAVSFAGVKERFLANVAPYGDKMRLYEGESASVLRRFHAGPFDLAYIDGSHLAPDVLTDAVLVWPLLAPHATLIFDDYEWPGVDASPAHRPKIAIDAFLACFADSLELVAKGYQVCVRKRAV